MEEMPEASRQKFSKDVLIIGASRVLAASIGLILMPLFTKKLGAFDYGIWSQVMVTVFLVPILVSLGLPAAMTRFLPVQKDRSEIQEGFYSVFYVTILISLLVSLAIIFSAEYIAEALFSGETEIVRITGLIILVWIPMPVCLGLLQVLGQMKKVAIFTVANAFGQVVLFTALIASGYGVTSIVYGFLAISVTQLFALLFLIRQQIGISWPHFTKIKEYLRFGLPTVPGTISSWVVSSSDRYVIAYFLGVTSVGVYYAGYALGGILALVPMALGFVLAPTLSRLYDEGKIDEVKAHLSFSLKYFLALAIPFVFGATVLSRKILWVFSTPEIATEGYLIVPLVAFSTLLIGIEIIRGQIIRLVKKTKIIGWTWMVAALANLVLNIVLVPRFGIVAAAITTLVAYALALGITTFFSVKEIRFGVEWGFILKSVIAAAVMYVLIWMLDPWRVLSIIAAVIVGIVIYGVILLLLKGFGGEDIKFFKGLFQRGS